VGGLGQGGMEHCSPATVWARTSNVASFNSLNGLYYHSGTKPQCMGTSSSCCALWASGERSHFRWSLVSCDDVGREQQGFAIGGKREKEECALAFEVRGLQVDRNGALRLCCHVVGRVITSGWALLDRWRVPLAAHRRSASVHNNVGRSCLESAGPAGLLKAIVMPARRSRCASHSKCATTCALECGRIADME
jgi:hypothetical protein